MAFARKILAKNNTVSGVDKIFYTVPGSTEAHGNLKIANASSAATIRVALVSAGGSVNWVTDSILNEIQITKNSPINYPGITLGADDDVVIRCSTSSVSFVLTGVEVT